MFLFLKKKKLFFQKNQIVHKESGLCLATELWMVVVAPCNLKDEKQHWKISSFEQFKNNLLHNINKNDREKF